MHRPEHILDGLRVACERHGLPQDAHAHEGSDRDAIPGGLGSPPPQFVSEGKIPTGHEPRQQYLSYLPRVRQHYLLYLPDHVKIIYYI